MTTTQAQQLDRCARALRHAGQALAEDDPLRTTVLMAARDEIDATIRVLRWRPRPRVQWGGIAARAAIIACLGLFGYVSGQVVLFIANHYAVEAQR
jgi:hypothetical protein